MRNRYKRTDALEIYELLDKVIATTDEATFYAQLNHTLEARKANGLYFNDHNRFVLPRRKAWRNIKREVKRNASNWNCEKN